MDVELITEIMFFCENTLVEMLKIKVLKIRNISTIEDRDQYHRYFGMLSAYLRLLDETVEGQRTLVSRFWSVAILKFKETAEYQEYVFSLEPGATNKLLNTIELEF